MLKGRSALIAGSTQGLGLAIAERLAGEGYSIMLNGFGESAEIEPTRDILINNAVVRHFAPIEEFRPQEGDRALAVNLSAALHSTRLVLPGMRARSCGRIINIAAVYGLFATVGSTT